MSSTALAVFVLVALINLGLLLWWRKRSTDATQQTEVGLARLRQQSWRATVTRVELEDTSVQQGNFYGKLKRLTVHYRQDDGQEGALIAYENDALHWTYIGALAFYKQAPGWDELSQWQEGDQLSKPVGEVFPHRE